jgi:hypothetical protein
MFSFLNYQYVESIQVHTTQIHFKMIPMFFLFRIERLYSDEFKIIIASVMMNND